MMKKIVVAIALGVLVFVSNSVSAADFFDDSGGKWWMNENWWEKQSDGVADIYQSGDKLIGTNDGDGYATYTSKWALQLNQDMTLKINFNFAAGDFGGDKRGGIGLDFTSTDPNHQGGLSMNVGGIGASDDYLWEWQFEGMSNSETDFANRAYDSGALLAFYDYSLKTMTFSSVDEPTVTKSFDFSGVSDNEMIRVVLSAGGDDGATFMNGTEYFTTFDLQNVTPIAPEPVSSVLFLLGGAAIIVARRRVRS